MMGGFQRFHKASASTSAVVSVFGHSVFPHLETDCGVRLARALVLWNAKPHPAHLHSPELDYVADLWFF